MFNLLPNEDRINVKEEYRRRVVVFSLLFLAIALASSIVLLLPSVYILSQNGGRLKEELEEFKKAPESEDYQILAKEVRLTRSRLQALKKYPERFEVAEILKKVVDGKPKGAKIDTITFSSAEDGLKITLNGIATNRELLRTFVNSLKNDTTFTGVDVPLSSFAKAEDAEFIITLSIKKKV